MLSRIIAILVTIIYFIQSWGQITRVGFGDMAGGWYVFEPFVAVTAGLLLITYRGTFSKRLLFNGGVWLLAWIVFSFLFNVNSHDPTHALIAFLYLMRLSAYLIFGALIMRYIRETGSDRLWLSLIYLIIGIILATTVVQLTLYPNLGNLAYLGWDPHVHRAFGLYFDPPLLGGILGMILLFGLTHRHILPHRVWYPAMVLTTAFVIGTFSRGVYVAFAVSALIHLRNYLSKKVIIIIFILGGGLWGIGAASGIESINVLRTASIQSRIDDYAVGFQIARTAPVIGIGYNFIREAKYPFEKQEFTEEINPSNAGGSFHSSFLTLLVTTGVIGFVLFLHLLYRLTLVSPFHRFAIWFLGILSLFDNVILHPLILIMFFLLGGYAARMRDKGTGAQESRS